MIRFLNRIYHKKRSPSGLLLKIQTFNLIITSCDRVGSYRVVGNFDFGDFDDLVVEQLLFWSSESCDCVRKSFYAQRFLSRERCVFGSVRVLQGDCSKRLLDNDCRYDNVSAP